MTSPIRLAAASLFAIPSLALGAATLPLQPGTYVREGSECVDPPFAAMMTYDGKAFSDPHSHDCRSTIVSRKGADYVVRTNCIAAGVGAAPRVAETERVTVLSPTRIATLGTTGAGKPDKAIFRRCGAVSRR